MKVTRGGRAMDYVLVILALVAVLVAGAWLLDRQLDDGLGRADAHPAVGLN